MKNKAKLHVVGFALAAMLAATTAQAQTYSRVYVAPKTGNDSNNCDTPTSPCLTLSSAYGKVDAGGEIVFVESGDFASGYSVQKSVSIIAPAGVEVGTVVSSGNGITVNSSTAQVVLRGLTLMWFTFSGQEPLARIRG
jgi:hypothetical protein